MMALDSQFTQASKIGGTRAGQLSGRYRLRVPILAVAASLLTVAPAPSWGQKGSDLRDDIEFDLPHPRVWREARDREAELWGDFFYPGDDAFKDERWGLVPRESDAPPSEANAGSAQQRLTGVAAGPLTVASESSSGQRVRREPRELNDSLLQGLYGHVADIFFPGHDEAFKDERWGLVPRESDAPPPGANAGSGQQRRTTSVPNLLDPFRTAGRGGGQSQRTGAASPAPRGFGVSVNFSPPDSLGGGPRLRSPANSSNRVFRGMNTPGGADRRPRN